MLALVTRFISDDTGNPTFFQSINKTMNDLPVDGETIVLDTTINRGPDDSHASDVPINKINIGEFGSDKATNSQISNNIPQVSEATSRRLVCERTSLI